MMKKRMYLLLAALLLLGTTACGKDADTTEMTTTQEQTEVATEEITTEEETTEVVTTEEATVEATTEAATEETAAEEAQSDGAITVEEAGQLIVKALGTEDTETGNKYAFMHVNTMTVDGVEYYVFTWSWYVDGTMSHLTDLFVATDGSAICEGLFVGDGATVYTETNYLEQ